MLDEKFRAEHHGAQRVRRAGAAFYGLTPLGLLTNRLSAADKVFLWKSVVLPALVFGCETAPLSPSDIDRLDARQAAWIKAALGLPRSSHHTALLRATGTPRIAEVLRRKAFHAFSSIFRSDHRLHLAYISGLAKLAVFPNELDGSFLAQLFAMCGGDFGALMRIAAGELNEDMVTAPLVDDGLVDSIRLVLAGNCQASRRLLRLLVC